MYYGWNSFTFGLMDLLIPLVWVLVLGFILFTLAQNVRTWNRNNHAARLTVPATVVTKRTAVRRHRHAVAGDATGAHGYTHSSSTFYYVTFQVESGDRMEFSVRGTDYGLLAEGDDGRLTFQGTRFLSFERTTD